MTAMMARWSVREGVVPAAMILVAATATLLLLLVVDKASSCPLLTL